MTVFNPKVLYGEDEIPTLSFEANAHLSWFRGYRFQVSGTIEGVGNCGSSTSSLQHDLALAELYNMGEDKEILYRQLITLSHVFEASGEFASLWKLLYKDDSLLNEMLINTSSIDSNLGTEEFSLHNLLNLVETNSTLDVTTQLKNYNISVSQTKPTKLGAIVSVGKDYLALCNPEIDTWYIINYADLFGVDFLEDDLVTLASRLIHVLQCKAGIFINTEVKYVNDNQFLGSESKSDLDFITPQSLYTLIYRKDFLTVNK